MRLLLSISLTAFITLLHAEDRPKFRTDADGPVKADAAKRAKGKSDSPEWYQIVEGKFPPEGSAHAMSGELILPSPFNASVVSAAR